jgi:thioredoxin reductase (NADPH)
VVDLAERLPELRRELTTRYGTDYVIQATSSTTAAHNILSGIATAAAEVALVLVAAHLDGARGADLLLAARTLHPIARRGLLIDYGEDRPSPAYLTKAAALGHMHHFLARPRRRGDERFHRAVTEFLEEWCASVAVTAAKSPR